MNTLSFVRTARVMSALTLLCSMMDVSTAQSPPARLVTAANAFLSSLDEKQREKALFEFSDQAQRARWSNLPVATPGVAMSSVVLAGIDTDSDAVISETERRAYVRQVLHDLSLTVDGDTMQLQLTSVRFPAVEDMREGPGEIQIEFGATLPRGGATRRLVFENHHLSRIAAYLVNCEVPRDRNIRIVAQRRNESQSFYQLDYVLGTG